MPGGESAAGVPVATGKSQVDAAPFRFLDHFRLIIAGDDSGALAVRDPVATAIHQGRDLLDGLDADDAETRAFRDRVHAAVAADPRFGERLWRGKEAEGLVEEAKAALRPAVSGGVTTGLGFFDGNANDNRRSVADQGTTTEADIFVSAQQHLYDFDATHNRIAATQAARRGIEAETRTIAGEIIFDAVTAWLGMARTNARSDLIAENMAVHELVVTYAEERREAGVGATTDVVRAQARLAQARASAAGFSAGRVDARNRFLELFSALPDGRENLPGAFLDLPDRLEDALINGAQTNARMRSARLISAQRLHERRAAEAAYMPTLSLQLRATRFDALSGEGDYELSGRIVGQISIDTSGAVGARVDQAKARHIQAARVLETTRRTADREISTAFQTVSARRDEVASFEMALLQNHQSRMAVLDQFRLRGVSLLEVLQAQEDFFDVAMRYIDARIAAQVAVFELARALGALPSAFDIAQGRLK
ncbi:MAG: TolC family protein [Minwuia sp.]|nr:TolC family protein [Minwuia sp.]